LILPQRIQEQGARGTEIRLGSDQLQVLGYWAQSSQEAQVGISITDGQWQTEYWLAIQLDPIADEPLENYLANLDAMWREKLSQIAPMLRLGPKGQEIEYVMKMRYIANSLRIWPTPKAGWDLGIRPLAEAAIPKDRWLAGKIDAVTIPPVGDHEAERDLHTRVPTR
jgi:hypothetical protein